MECIEIGSTMWAWVPQFLESPKFILEPRGQLLLASTITFGVFCIIGIILIRKVFQTLDKRSSAEIVMLLLCVCVCERERECVCVCITTTRRRAYTQTRTNVLFLLQTAREQVFETGSMSSDTAAELISSMKRVENVQFSFYIVEFFADLLVCAVGLLFAIW